LSSSDRNVSKLASLSPEKRNLLLARLGSGQIAADDTGSPKPTPAAEHAPLSYPQKRMWLVDQLAPGLPTYNVPITIRLRGAVNVDLFAGAVNSLVRRHEPLRTVVSDGVGEPEQRVLDVAEVPLPVVDLDQMSLDFACRQAVAEARRPFNLRVGPLLRAKLFRLADNDHLLVITMHHIACDGWSVTVLLRELVEFYTAAQQNRPPSLPDLPITYRDFAVWQRRNLDDEATAEDLAYWLGELGPQPPVVEFPADWPRPQVQNPAGGLYQHTLGPEITREIRTLCARSGATLFMVLGAALHTLLHRYTGLSEVLTGFPIANRQVSGVENLVGCFINTLVLRTDCAGDPTFESLLGQVRHRALDAYAHQDLPFERLVDELRLPRDTSRTPLVQVLLAVQNATETADLRLSDADIELVDLETNTTRFDVSLVVFETGDTIELSWEYASSLFEADTVRRFARHMTNILTSAVAQPTRRLSELSLLTPDELAGLTAGAGNDTPPVVGCLHELFAEQVKSTPDTVAVTSRGGTLTYRELDRRANDLANRLRASGVGPDVLVGLAVERGLEAVVGLLGILKAGGAYVPFDPGYPAERLAYMVNDTAAPVIVTTAAVAAGLPVRTDRLVLVPDPAWDPGEVPPPAGTEVRPDNLAYAIYTSGSTGQPKGVLVEHRNASCFVDAMIQYMGVTQRDRIVQFSSLNYDVSVFDIFTALLSGARLCLVDPEAVVDMGELTEILRGSGVTVADLPPAVLAMLDPAELPDLRLLFVGGEAYSGELVNRWLSPTRRFVNGYGPTEVTVAPVVHDCVGTYQQSPPIGRPIVAHRAYVLDAHGGLVPPGAPGELYLGGAGVARGYLNQPALTAERFLPDPFGDEPGARLYRTGDLVRYLSSGDIEFVGRVDDQIQLRGIRVEPGEIESVLERHPGVGKATVVLREDVNRRLVAYVVPVGGPPPTTRELRDMVSDELPRVLVPANIVLVPELPLMPSGKVDKAALPAPEDAGEYEFVAPRTDVEAVLANKIFAEVLGVDEIGVTDNFFELGGNSLQATQIVARMRDAFDVDIPLQAVFEKPTVADLAGLAANVGRPAAAAASDPSDVDSMTDEEVDVLLGRMLDGGGDD
jgi:amino acid adenylation domain-containing protein